MISSDVVLNHINKIHEITGLELGVYDGEGIMIAETAEMSVPGDVMASFINGPAQSMVVKDMQLFRVGETLDDGVLVLSPVGSETQLVGKITCCQLQEFATAYKEKYDSDSYWQNLLLDNLLLVDINGRAKKYKIKLQQPRVVYLIETVRDADEIALEVLKQAFEETNEDYVTSVKQSTLILVKSLEKGDSYEEVNSIAESIVDIMNTEAMLDVKVSYGTIVHELKDVSKSYKEAGMAMEVGKIFYVQNKVNAYNTLGVGRLIYQLPENLCRIFVQEIFGDNIPEELDEEIMNTVEKFFENNLNVSETSRQLFLARNTLVYRIEKLQKATGLDIRIFDDALVFKIALMVVNYMNYLKTQD